MRTARSMSLRATRPLPPSPWSCVAMAPMARSTRPRRSSNLATTASGGDSMGGGGSVLCLGILVSFLRQEAGDGLDKRDRGIPDPAGFAGGDQVRHVGHGGAVLVAWDGLAGQDAEEDVEDGLELLRWGELRHQGVDRLSQRVVDPEEGAVIQTADDVVHAVAGQCPLADFGGEEGVCPCRLRGFWRPRLGLEGVVKLPQLEVVQGRVRLDEGAVRDGHEAEGGHAEVPLMPRR